MIRRVVSCGDDTSHGSPGCQARVLTDVDPSIALPAPRKRLEAASRQFNTSRKPIMRSLNYRQRLFVESYLGEASKSAVDAARRAGYQWPEKEGPRLVEQRAVRAAIDAGVETPAMAANEVLARVAEVASSDLVDFIGVDDGGGCRVELKQVKRLGLGHLVRPLRIKKDGSQDIELEPKLPAMVKLGEYFKFWKGEAEQQITMVDVAKELEARYEKLQKDRENGNSSGEMPGPSRTCSMSCS